MSRTVDDLIERTLSSEAEDLLDAIQALSQHLDEQSAVDQLYVLLADDDVTVREAAAAALSGRGSPHEI